MSYNDKADEFQNAAELCLQSGHYNSAINRAYYSAYLLAKNKVWGTSNTERKHEVVQKAIFHLLRSQSGKIPMNTIKLFDKRWKFLRYTRVNADYFNENVSKDNADLAVHSLKIVKGIINGIK